MAPSPTKIVVPMRVVYLTRTEAAFHVWRRLGEMNVARRQRIVPCLIAWTHRPRSFEVPITYRRPGDDSAKAA